MEGEIMRFGRIGVLPGAIMASRGEMMVVKDALVICISLVILISAFVQQKKLFK